MSSMLSPQACKLEYILMLFRVVLANDLSPSACDAMRTNVALNGVGEADQVASNGTAGDGTTEAAEEISPEEQALNEENGEPAAVVEDDMGRRPGCHGYVHVNEGDAWSVADQERPAGKML